MGCGPSNGSITARERKNAVAGLKKSWRIADQYDRRVVGAAVAAVNEIWKTGWAQRTEKDSSRSMTNRRDE